MNSNDHGNLAASILLAGQLQQQERQKLIDSQHQHQAQVFSQQQEHAQQIKTIEQEHATQISHLHSQLSAQSMQIQQLEKRLELTENTLAQKNYNTLYYQNVLYSARLCLLQMAALQNIPPHIALQVSLLTSRTYMNGTLNVPSDLTSYFIPYETLQKSPEYNALLQNTHWSSSYEKRMQLALRGAQEQIATYLLQQRNLNPQFLAYLSTLEPRFANREETLRLLEQIRSEVQQEEAQKEQVLQKNLAEQKALQEVQERLSHWDQQERHYLELIENIRPGTPFPEQDMAPVLDRNYGWIPLVRHLYENPPLIRQGALINEGTFLKPKKQAPLAYILQEQPQKNLSFLLIPQHPFTQESLSAIEKNHQKIYNFGSHPVGTTIGKIHLKLYISRKNAQGDYVKKTHDLYWHLKEPFVVK